MSDAHHFRAFSFVDRITSVQPGVAIHGQYHVPAALSEFSGSLVSEAIGQLAAWMAMAAVNFQSRPVAGIAGLVEMLAPVRPGDTLELAAQIESMDADAIAYAGTASVNGSPVLRLHNCVGPMLPVEDFDDPQALRERHALLCGPGAHPDAFMGVPDLTLEHAVAADGLTVRATLQVPREAPFFSDHFPRRPVFPGTLLMQNKLSLVSQFAAQLPAPTRGGKWELRNVSDMKLRAFIPPGDALQLEAKLVQMEGQSAAVSVESRRNGKLAGAASVILSSPPIT